MTQWTSSKKVVNKAVKSTRAARKGNKKAGIVWHTQGSGKSLTMVFYSGKLVRELDNPTIVVLTDRNDLDDQLFGTFGRCQDILRQKPVQASSRKELRDLLKGGERKISCPVKQRKHCCNC